MIHEFELAVLVHELHEDHGPRAVLATSLDEPVAVRVHHHVHAAELVGDDFTVPEINKQINQS